MNAIFLPIITERQIHYITYGTVWEFALWDKHKGEVKLKDLAEHKDKLYNIISTSHVTSSSSARWTAT